MTCTSSMMPLAASHRHWRDKLPPDAWLLTQTCLLDCGGRYSTIEPLCQRASCLPHPWTSRRSISGGAARAQAILWLGARWTKLEWPTTWFDAVVAILDLSCLCLPCNRLDVVVMVALKLIGTESVSEISAAALWEKGAFPTFGCQAPSRDVQLQSGCCAGS